MIMIYVVFHIRRIKMHMSLNKTKHMYTDTTGLHMMIYMCLLHRCTHMLVIPEVVYLYVYG
jgi:hypothetical protein